MNMVNVATKLRSFESQILYFNGMYNLPIAQVPSLRKEQEFQNRVFASLGLSPKEAVVKRMSDFFDKILKDELNEHTEIVDKIEQGYEDIDILVELADLLGDIQVYCASEMARYGLPNKEILSIIMASNFSKLGADGKPIYDENGKVAKGPGYWKPEPQIKELLEQRIKEG